MNRNILQLSQNDSSNIAMETIEILDDDDEGESSQQSEIREEKVKELIAKQMRNHVNCHVSVKVSC